MLDEKAIDLWLLLLSLEDNVLAEKRRQHGYFVSLLRDYEICKLIDHRISRTLSLIRDIGELAISLIHERFRRSQTAINGLVKRWERFRHCSGQRHPGKHLGARHIGVSLIMFDKISAKTQPKSESNGN
jgi:hypothetical protein